jgi:hypothetical protein
MPANVFTPVIRNLTTAFQRVSQEMCPLPMLVQSDFKAEEAALNQAVTIPIAPTVAGADRTPAMIPTVAADRTVTNTTITITKDRKFAFHMTGDDFTRMQQNPEYVPISLQQAIRTWRNEVQSDLAGLHQYAAGYYDSTLANGSGAAVGTAGTTPFASAVDVAVDLEKFLNDSLAPLDDRFLMINTDCKANLGKLGQLIKANEAGTDSLLRNGIVGRLSGLNVVLANDVKRWTPVGTGASYVLNGAHAAGATSIVIKTGSGTVLAGDVLTINSVKYVVTTGVSAAGTVVISSGLVAAGADGDTVTVNAASRRNMAFHREALGLAIRLPKLPPEGDAGEHQVIADAITGIGLRFSTYKGYGLNNYELSSAWGVKTVRPELLKLLLG